MIATAQIVLAQVTNDLVMLLAIAVVFWIAVTLDGWCRKRRKK